MRVKVTFQNSVINNEFHSKFYDFESYEHQLTKEWKSDL